MLEDDLQEGPEVKRSTKCILIVAFKYPAYSAVGGKRWAKLSKYLARQDIDVHVLTVPWGNDDSDTLKDVSDSRIHIHRIPALAPSRIRVREQRTLLDRARNHIYRQRIAGRPWAQDAALWGAAVIPAVAWLARANRVQAIIVTGAPFMANYWVARAKALLPRIPLIQEFRDPWADLPDEALATQGGKDKVLIRECAVIESADAIVTVTNGLSELIRTKAGTTPVHTITNGFDPEDLPRESSARPRPFRLIHGGNLLVGRQKPLRAFLDAVSAVADEMPELELVFRGAFPEDVRNEYSRMEASGVLKVLAPIPAPAFTQELDDSFAALQFNAEHFPYALSTKIYEYGACRRPIVSLNYGGEIEQLVRNHDLGWSVDARDPSHISEHLRIIQAEWLRDPALSTEPTQFAQYSYESIASAYSNFIGTLL